MKEICRNIPISSIEGHSWIDHYFSENFVFFDIETTGFSPKNSFAYLIGMAKRTGNAIQICQLFAENRQEEASVIKNFYQKLPKGCTLVSFHGNGFDIPYLKGREEACHIEAKWDSYFYLDLYQITGKYAHFFRLQNKKQKSIEKFLGIDREDRFSGGELIPLYYSYEQSHHAETEAILLLHNYDDVFGMVKLLPLLAYRDFFENPLNVQSARVVESLLYNGSIKKELLLSFDVPMPFPKELRCKGEGCNLMCRKSDAKLLVDIFCGELKYYYENYKDYYYLPEEDLAIHKSVASFVDASHRKKATAATCYSRKEGQFLPQPKNLFAPRFYSGKKSGASYFELTDEFLSDANSLSFYASFLFRHSLR